MGLGLGAPAVCDVKPHVLLLSCTSPHISLNSSPQRGAEGPGESAKDIWAYSFTSEYNRGGKRFIESNCFHSPSPADTQASCVRLISSRSTHAGYVGMAASHSPLLQPPSPGAAPCQPSNPHSQRHSGSTHREQLRFPPSGFSLQIQVPNILLLTQRLNGKIWVLSLCLPFPLCNHKIPSVPCTMASGLTLGFSTLWDIRQKPLQILNWTPPKYQPRLRDGYGVLWLMQFASTGFLQD